MRNVGAEGLRAAGLPAETAASLCGAEKSVHICSGAGTTINDATLINGDIVMVSGGASNSGIKLPAVPLGSMIYVSNYSGQTIYVWPDTAANAIFATTGTSGTAAAAYTSMTSGKTAIFVKIGTTTTAWRATLVD